MVMDLLFFSLLLACCCYEVQTRDFCKNLPAGQYCTDNLNGYYNCGDTNSRGILYKCRRNTRCSCHLKKNCVLPRNEICQSYKDPLPFARNFMLSGFALETVTLPDGTAKRQNLHGQVFRNSETGKFRRERWTGLTGNANSYQFEYFFLKNNGKYLRVSEAHFILSFILDGSSN